MFPAQMIFRSNLTGCPRSTLPRHIRSDNNESRFAPETAPCHSGAMVYNMTKTGRCSCNTVACRTLCAASSYSIRIENGAPRWIQVTGMSIMTQHLVAANPASVASTCSRQRSRAWGQIWSASIMTWSRTSSRTGRTTSSQNNQQDTLVKRCWWR
ncbi:hypothetical protein LX36DRAFT_387463 [Colletotrichum falcatum]|nr:hypothetical protein LX36DRAFT_387463 [Colletotrichum falcatum]